jgi:hypothetical protein
MGENFPRESLICDINGTPLTSPDDKRHTALAAQGPLAQTSLRHAIFRSATETSDNHIVEMGMTSATRGPVMNTIPLYTIPRPAVEAPNYHLFMCHFHPHSISNIIIIRG